VCGGLLFQTSQRVYVDRPPPKGGVEGVRLGARAYIASVVKLEVVGMRRPQFLVDKDAQGAPSVPPPPGPVRWAGPSAGKLVSADTHRARRRPLDLGSD